MIKIVIPFKTPSINHLHGHNKFGAFYLKPEAKELRKKIFDLVKIANVEKLKDEKLKVVVEIHENWFCKNGSVKRVDIANREKFLVDSVFGALELDDKFIFDHTMKKIQSKDEKALIKIYGIKKQNK